ncbi:MAG TPA: Hsp20/alpha crystallin family protein [Leptospiraceae bacterium]|nr:Hsp20/alpha crystallin family protein [Leptospiraceae bacterium]
MSKLVRQNNNDFENIFNKFFTTPAIREFFETDKNTFYKGAVSFPCDIVEQEDSTAIYMDIPGMDESDIKIKYENNTLIIQGERKFENKTSTNSFSRAERMFGKFSRTWTVPENLDTDKTEASYEKGVLIVRIPKKEQTKARTVEVKLLGK